MSLALLGVGATLVESDDVPLVLVQAEDILAEDGRVVGQRTRYYVERVRMECFRDDGTILVEKLSGEPITVRAVEEAECRSAETCKGHAG